MIYLMTSKMSKEQIHELLGYENIKIIQDEEMFSFSLDSMLLANFIDTTGAKRIIDLGCGNAPIPLFLTLKTKSSIIGVELQEKVADLAKRSVELNHFENQIKIINDDLKDIYKKVGANSFDIVSSNPPYFPYKEDSMINKNDYLTIARHEVKAKLSDIVNEARKLLIDGGKFYMVHRVSRITEVIKTLEEYNFGIKKIQMIHPKVDGDAMMFLIESRKNKPSDVKVIKPLYVYDGDKYTNEVLEIFNFKKGE